MITVAQHSLDALEALNRRLPLRHMCTESPDVLRTVKAHRWDSTERLRTLLVAEAEGRRHRSSAGTRPKAALFPAGKTFDRPGTGPAPVSRGLPRLVAVRDG